VVSAVSHLLNACSLAALLSLAACEDYGRVTQTQVDPGYSPDELGYAGGLVRRVGLAAFAAIAFSGSRLE